MIEGQASSLFRKMARGFVIGVFVFYLGFVSPTWGQDSETRTRVQYSIIEESPDGTLIGEIAEDADLDLKYSQDVLNKLQYSFLRPDGIYSSYFEIEESTGNLKTIRTVDREELCPNGPIYCDVEFDVAVRPVPVKFLEIINVVVNIEDLNDHSPMFPDSEVALEISESVAPGAMYILPTALDPDSGPYTVKQYSLLAPYGVFGLQVDNSSGIPTDVRLRLNKQLDREKEPSYTLELVAKDGGSPPRSGTLTVHVAVQDANDNSPVFEEESYVVTVREDAAPGTPIVRLRANDPDYGPSGQIEYSIMSEGVSRYPGPFEINARNGQLVVTQPLDYEKTSQYHLMVSAKDKGPDAVPSHTRVTINVIDVNDHAPTVSVNSLTSSGRVEIPENVDPGYFVAHISVEDGDAGINGEAICNVRDDHFYVDSIYRNEYKVITKKTFDREITPVIPLPIECQDQGDPPLTSRQIIEITILDENDHTPVFTQKIYRKAIKENNTVGIPLLRVNATDRDLGQNARITYTLQRDARGLVEIDSRTGVIRANSVFDFESRPFIKFGVEATDGGSPSRSATATVKLEIQDVNDEPPQFSKPVYSFATFENQSPGTEIGGVAAHDADNPPHDVYSFSIQAKGIARDVFAIDSDSGRITTRKTLDRESQPVYTFKVVAANPGFYSLASTANVTVHVADRNDNIPKFVFPNSDNSTVEAPHKGPVGYIFSRVIAVDDDFGVNAKISYSIVNGNSGNAFSIDPYSGALKLNRRHLKLDKYKIMVEASDNGSPQQTAVAELTVNVNTSAVIADLGYNSRNSGLDRFTASRNHTIAICIGAATLVLVIILLACIICLKKKQRREKRDTYKYICHVNNRSPHRQNGPVTEPEMTELTTTVVDGTLNNREVHKKVMDSSKTGDSSADEEGHDKDGEYTKFVQPGPDEELSAPPGQTKLAEDSLAKAGTPTIHSSPKRQAVCSTSPKAPLAQGECRLITFSPKHMSHNSFGSASLDRSLEANKTRSLPRHRLIFDPSVLQQRQAAGAAANSGGLTEKDIEMHQLLHMLRREPPRGDSDSNSGDGSNADSGRGGSEDGDPQHGHGNGAKHPVDDHNSPPPPYDSLWDQRQRSLGHPTTKPKPSLSHEHKENGENDTLGHKYHSSTLPKDLHGPYHSSGLSSINENGSGVNTGDSADDNPANPKWVKVMLPVSKKPLHPHGIGSVPTLSGSHSISNASARTNLNDSGVSSGGSVGSPLLSNGDRSQSSDLLSHKRLNGLSEADKRSILNRNQRIAPEGGDNIYVNTFGQSYPLKNIGRLEEPRDISREGMNSYEENGAHSPDDLPPTRQSIV